MAGLLDLADDPASQGLLSLGLRLMSTPGNFMSALGQSGLGAMGDLNSATQAKQRRDLLAQEERSRAMQMRALEEQMRKQQEAEARAKAIEDAYRGAMRSPDQQAMAANGGPTMAAANAAPGMAPMVDQAALIRNLMQADPMAAFQMLQPKPDELMTVAPGASLVNKRDPSRPLFTAPREPAALPTAVQEYEFAKSQGFTGSFEQWKKDNARAGASRVEVNTGQRGLDNTLKLRGDFRSEPVYKAHQEMTSAYSQIQQSLKQASPAGDLAGATKLMKLLDPGSVVRESELGMAMAASGLMDRAQNYVSNIVSGNKLTPTQRKDFQSLADALFAESVKSYNGKRQEYQGIAERNGLPVADVLGLPAKAPGGEWKMERVK